MGTSLSKFRLPEKLWNRMNELIPVVPRTTLRGGRPRIQKLKPIADGVFYKLRTGCQWNAIPRAFGPSSTIHDYFQRWVTSGLFEKLWELALKEYDELVGVQWSHQSIDASNVKAPLGGKKNRTKSNRSRKVGNKEIHFGGRTRRSFSSCDRLGKSTRFEALSTNTEKQKVSSKENKGQKTHPHTRRQRV